MSVQAQDAPAKDKWFTDNLFCYRDQVSTIDDKYKDRTTDVMWVADPEEATNGCIKVVADAGADQPHTCQFWIRGAEVVDPADLKKGAFAEGNGFKLTMRVKGDGEYSNMIAQAHGKGAWKYIDNAFGSLNVTTEWQTVTFVCIANAKMALAENSFTDIAFNISDNTNKTARTIYIDDVQIVRGSEWYINNEFHAKDYLDPTASYSDDMNKPHPVARYVADGDYVEVTSNAKATETYNCQLWIQIPEKYVGGSAKMTMEVQASKAITCPENYQATATGCGWGCSTQPGTGVVLPAGEWTTVERIVNTKGIVSNTWNSSWNGWQADQYCLDLSEKLKIEDAWAGDAITYKFKNVKFEQAQEDWFFKTTPTARDYEGFTQEQILDEETGEPKPVSGWGANGWGPLTYNNGAPKYELSRPKFDITRYLFDEGCIEIKSNDMPVNDYDCQFFIKVSDKPLKKNQIVTVSMKVKTDSETAVSVGTGVHYQVDGWTNNATTALTFAVSEEWQDITGTFNIENDQLYEGDNAKGGVWYALSLSDLATEKAHTYWFDDITIKVEDAPVLAWEDLIPLHDFESGYTGEDDEPLYIFSKEQPVHGSDAIRARIVKGVGVDGGNGIEFRTNNSPTNSYDNQFELRFPYVVPDGTKIKVSFDYKGNATGNYGTQLWDGGFGSYSGGGSPQMKVTEVDTWAHYEEIYTVKSNSGNGMRFNVFDISPSTASIFYFDNVQVQVPEGTVFEGDPTPLLGKDYPVFDWTDPSTVEYTEELITNGNLEDEGEDMSSFAAKITTEDETDPETLPAVADDLGKYAASSAALWPEGATVPEGAKGININTEATGEDGKASDTQLIVRLNKVIPAGTLYKVEFDLMSTSLAEISTEIDADPGVKLSGDGIAKGAAGSAAVKVEAAGKYVHYENFCKAPEGGMRSIVFNLAGEKKAKYWFDNFSVKIPAEALEAATAATETADATSMWAETLALNVAVNNGKNTDTEGYTDESVLALTTAITDGKAELKNAEATKATLAAAAKAINDAIAGLEEPEEFLDMPELAEGEFEKIPEDQGVGLDPFTRCATAQGEYNGAAYTTYSTSSDGAEVAIKMPNMDVTGCDYVVFYFAQPAKAGWQVAFWGIPDPSGLVAIPEGATSYKFEFAKDPKGGAVVDNTIQEITLMTLGAANSDIKVYGVYKHKVPVELSYTDLTKEMFFQWSAADGTGDPIANSNCDLNVGDAAEMVYGLSTVNHDRFADLSEYATIEVTTAATAENEPRLLFNRIENEGTVYQEVPRDAAKFEKVVENEDGTKTYIVDIAAIVAEQGYAHLHAIKRNGWSGTTTVTSIKLGYVGEAPEIPVPVAIEGVEVEGETLADGKYIENGQIVIVKGGKKYTVAGVEIK